MPRRFTRSAAGLIGVLFILALSGVALAYASWLRGIERSNQFLAEGNTAASLQGYDKALRTVAVLPSSIRIVLAGYRELIYNRARALYVAQRPDELTRFLESQSAVAPQLADDAEYQYWIGNVQFNNATAQKDKQQVQSGLQQAAESYRRALAAAPGDWDAKYNYELTSRLLEGLSKGKEKDLEKSKRGQMKILREDNEKKQEQQRQVAPEKRG